jgi:hypothetical protein
MLTVATVHLYHRNTYEGSEGEENKHDDNNNNNNNNNNDKEAVGHKRAAKNPRARNNSRCQGVKLSNL